METCSERFCVDVFLNETNDNHLGTKCVGVPGLGFGIPGQRHHPKAVLLKLA